MILSRYLFIGFLLLFAVGFALAPLVLIRIVGPLRPAPYKNQTAECGMVTQGETWVRFRIQYFVYALLFVVFDVETVFLYPWAASYMSLGWYALLEMIVFLALVTVGLAYAWSLGALKWL